MNVYSRPYGITRNGDAATLYTLMGESGMTVEITDFGGTLTSIKTPDRTGKLAEVILGYDSLADYEQADGYLGALVGRVANRIGGSSFDLGGVHYELYANDGKHHLHGGRVGYNAVLWNATPAVTDTAASLILTYRSPDGEEGYPGNLDVTVTYTLTSDNALSIHYEAVCDKDTPVCLTNHAYFNLAGAASGTVLDHILWLDAESYVPGDEGLIPTGEIKSVEGTPFDFRTPKPIGQDFGADCIDLHRAGGYDHSLNFTDWKACRSGGEVMLRGYLYDPSTGRKMEMYTSQPCVQFYSANFLKNPAFPLRGGYPQRTQTAICLETQTMPDSVHHQGEENYTDGILRAGDTYDHTTVYRFTAE